MHVLMAWGGFRFSMASFAYEEIKRKFEARIEPQNLIDARPSLHNMGPGLETLGLTSTFFPRHLPGNRGLSQLAGLRAAVGSSSPLIGKPGLGADAFGRWALKSLEDTGTEIYVDGQGQQMEAVLEFYFDGRGRSAGAMAQFARLFG